MAEISAFILACFPCKCKKEKLLAGLVGAGEGEGHPLGDVGAMVSDPLKILGNHQKIQRKFSLIGILGNQTDNASRGEITGITRFSRK